MDARERKVSGETVQGRQWALKGLFCALALAGCSRHTPATGDAAQRQTPSGLPVPRYIALKFGKVNARGGPGDDYNLLWVYHAKGLPLQVVAETDEWRRVCDSDGALSWVHRRTTDAQRTVIRPSLQPATVRAKPTDAAPETATLVGHAIAELKTCKDGWCAISVGRVKGWVRAADVWGTVETPQCQGK